MHRLERVMPQAQGRQSSFFVPILNLFRPCQIMKEIWAGSNPAAVQDGRVARRPRVPALVSWWWVLWLAMNLVGFLAVRMAMDADSIYVLVAVGWTSLVSDLLAVPAAVLAILVVRRADAHQDERYRLLNPSSSPVPVGFSP